MATAQARRFDAPRFLERFGRGAGGVELAAKACRAGAVNHAHACELRFVSGDGAFGTVHREVIEIALWTESDDFRRLLSAFEQALPLRRPSQLTQRAVARFLIATSGGLLGAVSRLLNAAAELAIVNGSECISLALLEEAAHAHA